MIHAGKEELESRCWARIQEKYYNKHNRLIGKTVYSLLLRVTSKPNLMIVYVYVANLFLLIVLRIGSDEDSCGRCVLMKIAVVAVF